MLTPHLAENLRDAIKDIEHENDIDPNDPDFVELKRIVQAVIDSLESERVFPAESDATKQWVRVR